MLRFATPLVFAALGGVISERSGVVNIGLEGMMLVGAFFGIYGADLTNGWVGGLLIGMLAGGLLALVHAFFAVSLRADQIVSGFAINFLALGMTGYIFLHHYGDEGTPDDLPQVPDVTLPIDWIPFFGPALEKLNLLVWVALILVFVVWLFVFRTPAGLRLRSVGENPRAAATVGISVYKVALPRGHRLGRAGGDGRRVPLHRLRPLVQPEHDGGARVHRARGRDRGQVAAGGSARGGAACSGSHRRWRSGCRCSRRARRRCCRRCRTW